MIKKKSPAWYFWRTKYKKKGSYYCTFYLWAASDDVTVASDSSILRRGDQLVNVIENDLEIVGEKKLEISFTDFFK